MNFNQNVSLYTSQKQQLKLSQSLRLGMDLIQMNNQELDQWLDQKIQENPFLIDAAWSDGSVCELPARAENSNDVSDFSMQRMSTDLQSNPQGKNALNSSRAYDSIEDQEIEAAENTFEKELLEQLLLLRLPEELLEACRFLVGNLDEQGWLTDDLADLADSLGAVGELKDDVICLFEDALEVIQSLEPAGVGASNRIEALRLQIEREHEPSETRDLAILLLTQEPMKKLLRPDCNELAKQYQCSSQLIRAAVELIRSLDPKSVSRLISSEPTIAIRPDLIAFLEKGVWQIDLNPNSWRAIEVDVRVGHLFKAYIKQQKQHQRETEANDFETRRFDSEGRVDIETESRTSENTETDAADSLSLEQQAKQIVQQLQYRQDTLLLVGQAIAARQQDFFTQGMRALKPMTLSDIASEIDRHESTISRLVNGKYIETQHGLIELRSFFSSQVHQSAQTKKSPTHERTWTRFDEKALMIESKSDTEETLMSASQPQAEGVSSKMIQAIIRDLVRQEDPRKPYSDQKIVDLLMSLHRIEVARRTITKYRDALGIASAPDRKKR